ncbi:MAG: HAD hydrolase family protein [Oscillospiraceae bacterium]|nr:HAD hydrolase family protein [Oscillospiraceae bacterium]
MIKMIVSDLDGTFLRDDKTVSNRTIEVFRHCRGAGIKTVFATARGSSATGLIPEGLFDGRIVNNGARAMAGDEIVYDRPVPEDLARYLKKACGGRGLDIVFNSALGKVYAEGCGSEDAAFIKGLLPEDLHLYVSLDNIAMVMHKDATKSKATAELARHWGIAREEIAAFGDDLNDIDLLSYAGTGVAMGNALEEVKAAADGVCGSNEEDGMAVWLLKHFASVTDAESKGVLICEPSGHCGETVVSALKNLGVRCKLVFSEAEVYQELPGGEWSLIFAASSLHDNIRILAPKLCPGVKPVILAEPGEQPHALNTVNLPVNPISIANILNGGSGFVHHEAPPFSPERAEQSWAIEGLDTEKGLRLMGGSEEKFRYMLSAFLRDALEKIGKIKACLEAGDFALYATHVHALKSAALYIGADALSEVAKELETAGKKGDLAYIEANNPGFIADLEELLPRISQVVYQSRD